MATSELVRYNETVLCYSTDDIYNHIKEYVGLFIDQYAKAGDYSPFTIKGLKKDCAIKIEGKSYLGDSSDGRLLFSETLYASPDDDWKFVDQGDTFSLVGDELFVQGLTRTECSDRIEHELEENSIPPKDIYRGIVVRMYFVRSNPTPYRTVYRTVVKTLVLHQDVYNEYSKQDCGSCSMEDDYDRGRCQPLTRAGCDNRSVVHSGM